VTPLQSFLLAAGALAFLVGAAFAVGTGYYLSGYLGAESPVIARDHLVGLGLGLRYTFGAFAVAAGLVLPVRRVLPPALVRVMVIPAAVSGAVLIGWLTLRLADGGA
jgi:hypothetical protein